MWLAIYIILFAFFNRARGSNFATLIPSDTADRLTAAFGMAAITSQPYAHAHWEALLMFFGIVWLLFYLWMVAGWDAYWSAAIGSDPNHSRLWGVACMTLRMAMILPVYVFLADMGDNWEHLYYGASFLLMGATYWLSSVLTEKYTICFAEWMNGAIIGATVWAIT